MRNGTSHFFNICNLPSAQSCRNIMHLCISLCFSPPPLSNNFETQWFQLNLTGSRGLKNNYVHTSSIERECV